MAAETYSNIRSFATSLFQLLVDRNQGISNSTPQDEKLVFYMDKQQVLELLNQTGCEKIAAVLGIEGGKATVSLLCTDSNNRILESHITGSLDGQETWDQSASGSDLTTALPEPQTK